MVDSFDVGFEWRDDDGTYKLYTDDTQTQLVSDVLRGCCKCSVKLPPRNAVAEVDFDKMTQTNVKTKWERLFRCCIRDTHTNTSTTATNAQGDSGDENNGLSWNCWEWENESKVFVPYSVENSIKLESQYIADRKQRVTLANKLYEVDLDNMVQFNIKTGFSRNIRRIKSNNTHKVVVDRSTFDFKKENGVKLEKMDTETDEGTATESKRGTKRKPDVERSNSANMQDESSEVKTSKSSKSGKSVGGTLSSGTKKLAFSGKAPVDDECVEKKTVSHVFVDTNGNGTIYDAMLNQTNVGNNNNKYYLLQLLEDNNAKNYHVWFRWGRVGYKGQNSLQSFGPDLEKAKSTFTKKFYDKTLNDWHDRKHFEKVAGKYDLVAIDYGNSSPKKLESKLVKNEIKKEEAPTKLDPKVFELMRTICNITAMENTVKELEYDLSKAPLGKLTSSQIKAGYEALDDISKLIENKVTSGSKLSEACSRFYTRIPHAFGFKVPPVINTLDKIKEKLDLLDALEQIEIALSIIKSESDENQNPVDHQYESLKCDITPVSKDDKLFSIIETYLHNTHASTHNMYKMKVDQIFNLDKDGENKNFESKIGNRHLLWHGTRQSNVVGILSHGLKIAPSEAPVTGYMFGKGIYFADMSSKSANYCHSSPSNTTGFVLLCDVALGKCNELIDADYKAHKLPSGCHSVFGVGREEPDPNGKKTLNDRADEEETDGPVTVPCGKPKKSKAPRTTLNYNEYIVYKTNQIKLKYLVKINFDYDEFL